MICVKVLLDFLNIDIAMNFIEEVLLDINDLKFLHRGIAIIAG